MAVETLQYHHKHTHPHKLPCTIYIDNVYDDGQCTCSYSVVTSLTIISPLSDMGTREPLRKAVAGTTPTPTTHTSASNILPEGRTTCLIYRTAEINGIMIIKLTHPSSPTNCFTPALSSNFIPLSSCI